MEVCQGADIFCLHRHGSAENVLPTKVGTLNSNAGGLTAQHLPTEAITNLRLHFTAHELKYRCIPHLQAIMWVWIREMMHD